MHRDCGLRCDTAPAFLWAFDDPNHKSLCASRNILYKSVQKYNLKILKRWNLSDTDCLGNGQSANFRTTPREPQVYKNKRRTVRINTRIHADLSHFVINRVKHSNPTKEFYRLNPQFHQNKQKYRINCGIFVYLWSGLFHQRYSTSITNP